MRPKNRYRKVEYWDCGKGHYHKTEAAAQKCMDRPKRREKFDESTVDEIAIAVLNGEKAAKVARKYGCSPTTVVSYVDKKMRAHEKYNFKEYLEQLMQPGSGLLKTAVLMWNRWNKE